MKQHVLRVGIGVLKNLAGEIIEEDLRRRPTWPERGPALAPELLEQQDEARAPPIGRLVQGADRRPGPPSGRQPPDQAGRLGVRQAKLGPIQDLDRALDAKAGEGRDGLGTTDEDHVPARRDLPQRLPHDLVKRRRGRRLLIVVEDEGERRLQAAVELAEEAPREDGESLKILRRQERQRSATPGG